MIEKFITQYSQLIVNHPELVTVEKEMQNNGFCQITIYVHESDIGKLIGKNGNMINAIKTMVNGCKAKDGVSYKLQVKSV